MLSVRCQNGHTFLIDQKNLSGNSTTCPKCNSAVTLQATPSAKPMPETRFAPGGQRKSPLLWIGLSVGAILGLTVLLTIVFLSWKPSAVTSLGGNDADTIRDIAERFFTSENPDDMLELVTKKARDHLVQNQQKPGTYSLSPGITQAVGVPSILGDLAEVTVDMREAGQSSGSVRLKVRREPEGWRVYAFTSDFEADNPDSGFEFNLEGDDESFFGDVKNAMEDTTMQMGESFENAINAAPDLSPTQADITNASVQSMSPMDFEATWKIKQFVSNQPAGNRIAELADELGLNYSPDQKFERLLDRPITLPETACSRIEFLERVCATIGLYTDLDLPTSQYGETDDSRPVLTLEPLPRANPVAFAGPLRVNFQTVTTPPYGIGKIQCQVWGPECPVVSKETLLRAEAEFTELRSSEFDLMQPKSIQTYNLGGRKWPGLYLEHSHGLRHLLKSVTSIESCTGVVRIILPSNIETVTFASPFEKAEQQVGGNQVTLSAKNVGFSSENGFVTKVKGFHSPLVIVARDESRELLRVKYGDSSSQLGSIPLVEQEFSTVVAPQELQVRLATEQIVVEYPFSVQQIPISDFEQMPDRIEPLEIAGAEPATLEYLRRKKGVHGGNDETLEFSLKNHTNKPIREAVFDGVFLDQNGQKIESKILMFAVSITTHRTAAGETESFTPLASAGEEATVEEWAPFTPKTFSSMRFKLRSLAFADGESWNATE